MTRCAIALLVVALLPLPMPAAVGAESSLTTALDSAGSPRHRLIADAPLTDSGGSLRVIVWTGWVTGPYPTLADFRAALTTANLGVGPMVLRGGLQDLANPHRVSFRLPTRERATGVVVDAGMTPSRRYGITCSPPSTPLRWSWLRDSVRDTVVGSLGGPSGRGGAPELGAHSGAGWSELTVVGTFPHNLPAGAMPIPDGWFNREPLPADTIHLLFRAAGAPVRTPRVDVAPVAIVSLGPTIRPGWWTRLGWHAAPVGESGGGDPAVSAAARIAMSSPGFRGPGGDASPHAVSLSGRIIAEGSGGWLVQTDGNLVLDWVPAAFTPGVPFSLREVQPDAAEFGVGWSTGSGRAGSVFECRVAFDWSEAAFPVTEASVTGAFRPRTGALAAEGDRGTMLAVAPEFSATVRRRESVEAVGTAALGVGPEGMGRTSPFTLVGSVVLQEEEAARLIDAFEIGCRVEFTSAAGECRGGFTTRWSPGSLTPPGRDFHLTWKAVRGGE